MTPPTAAATPLRRPGRVPPSAPARPGHLSPARPAAVLVPPLVVWAISVSAIVGVHALLIYESSLLTFLRLGLLVALHVPLVFVARAVADGLGGRRLERAVVPAYAVTFVFLLDAGLPGHGLHPGTAVMIVAVSLVGGPLTRRWRDWWVRHRPARVTLLASSAWGADEAIRRLEQIPGLVVENVVLPQAAGSGARLGRPISAGPDDVVRAEKRIVVSCPLRDPSVAALIARYVALGHHIASESSLLRAAEGRIDTDRANPLELLLGRPRHWVAGAASRGMDMAVSACLLVLLLPVFAAIALAIRLEDGGPVLYRQRRVGLRGAPFDLIKFRSMRADAERGEPVWAVQRDPRVTRVGRVLRRTRLDELPQLVNVLLGSMALVGPRPERPHFFGVLRRDVPLFELRTCVRPGITGWAQVRAPYADGSEGSRTKLAYDLYYVTRRSPWFDMAILFETAGVAFSGRGAR